MKANCLFSVARCVVFCAIFAFAFGSFAAKQSVGGPITVVGDVVTIGSGTVPYMPATGTAPNSTPWTTFMTGSAPVAYFVVEGPHVPGDTAIGSLMFDPKGKSINNVDFRYGYFQTIGSGTAGPYVFTTGSGVNAVSTSSTMKTLPAGTWAAVTTFPARLAGSVSITSSPSLATSGGNIASTNGWFNQPWDFGVVAPTVTQTLMYSTAAGEGFRAVASVNNPAPVNLLGYGNGYGMFSFVEAGVTGIQYGAVIPVWAVPEPSTMVLAVLGGLASLGIQFRRRMALNHMRTRPTGR